MTDIKFDCQKCGQHLVIDESGVGTFVDCPKCGDQLLVPPVTIVLKQVAPSEQATEEMPEDAPPRIVSPEERASRRQKLVFLTWFCTSSAVMLFGLILHNSSVFGVGLVSLIVESLWFVILHGSRLVEESITEKEAQARELQARVDAFIQKHIEALRIKREQKRRPDGYGNFLEEDWEKELEYFCRKVLRPAFPHICNWALLDRYPRIAKDPLNARDPGLLDTVFLTDGQLRKARREAGIAHDMLYARNTRQGLYQRINKAIDDYSKGKPLGTIDPATFTPALFEAYCTQLLNDNGWQADKTAACGDQGVDILARRNGKKAVFQCKLYSSLVGNAAVQEAIAGKAWASADYAFVVTNAGFTPQAEALATKTGVHLIHYSSLARLDQYLS